MEVYGWGIAFLRLHAALVTAQTARDDAPLGVRGEAVLLGFQQSPSKPQRLRSEAGEMLVSGLGAPDLDCAAVRPGQ